MPDTTVRTIELLPVPIPTVLIGAVGPSNGYPIGLGVNRLLRLWRVNTWRMVISMSLIKKSSPPYKGGTQWTLEKTIDFKNHTVGGPLKDGDEYEPTVGDDLRFPRHTDFSQELEAEPTQPKVEYPPGIVRVRLFSATDDESVLRVGELYYPKVVVDLTLNTELYDLILGLDPSLPYNTKTNVLLDQQLVGELKTSSQSDAEVQFFGYKVSLDPLDFYY